METSVSGSPQRCMNLKMSIAIHPSIHCQPLIQNRVAGAATSVASPRLPFPRPHRLTLTGNPQALPGQRRDIIPPPDPWSTLRSPPSRMCQEHLPRKAPWWHPHQMPEPPQQSSGSTPSPCRMAEPLTLSLRETPATLQREPISAACTRDLILTIGEGRDED